MLPSATVLLFPWLVALALTPLVIRWGTAHGYIDRPGARKIHDRPTVAIGGPAVFGSAAIEAVAQRGAGEDEAAQHHEHRHRSVTLDQERR